MRNLKKTYDMIRYNIWTLVGFEIIFKTLSFAIFTPLFLGLFNLVMKLTGYSYLTLENIFQFLSNPRTIIMLLILIILMTIYTMFDITTIIIILDESYHKRKIKAIDAIGLALKKCQKLFFPTNILIAFMVLFLIPFLNIGVTSSFISTIKVPEFILDFIINNTLFLSILIITMFILSVMLLRWIYALHYFVLEDLNFLKAKKKSINLSRKSHLKDLLVIIIIQLVSVLIYFIFVILGILLILYINKICNIIWLKSFTTTIIWVFIGISFIIFTLLTTPLSYATISSLYYHHKEKLEEPLKSIPRKNINNDIKVSIRLKKLIAFIIVIAIIGGSIFSYGIYKGKYNLNIEYVRTIEVTAHRGASNLYPENTMSAFIGAKELGADWIELDVGATKDGEIIVLHDSNLKRIAGLDKFIWELTLAEIKELDAGSHFNSRFQNERIPTLTEVIKFAKENNIKLNIEIKPTGHEEKLEEKVIDIINENNFKDECVITSQIYEVLEKVKTYDPKQTTIYVMSLAYGNLSKLKYADHFSIEASSVNSSLVKELHKNGKKLLVWTVNTKENIQKMIDLKVDNIVTDDITLVKDTVYSSKTSDVIQEFIKFIENIF